MAKKKQTENILLDSIGVELLVTYSYEFFRSYEECHGMHDTSHYDIDIEYVELVIAGESVSIGGATNLYPFLTKNQVHEIESQLSLEEQH